MIPELDLIHDSSIGSTPAQVDRRTGEITVNPDVFYNLTPFQQRFVIMHELGHYHLQTTSEVEADAYAFDQLIGSEYKSLKQCLGSIAELLDDDNETKAERYKALYIRALKWDAAHGNPWAKEELAKKLSPINNYSGLEIFFGKDNEGDTDYKKAQARYLDSLSDTNTANVAANLQRSKWNYVVILCIIAGVIYYYYFKK